MLFDHDWDMQQLEKGNHVCVFAVDRKHHRLQNEAFVAENRINARIKDNKIWHYDSIVVRTRDEYNRMVEGDKKNWHGVGEYTVNKYEPQPDALESVGKGLVVFKWALEVGLFLLFAIPILSAIMKIK